MSDEKFFSQVKNSLEFYAPEAPQEVYLGMRRKLWWSGFTKLSATRFNMWYLILLIGLGSALLVYQNTCSASASECQVKPLVPQVNQTIEVPKATIENSEEESAITVVSEPAVHQPSNVVSLPVIKNEHKSDKGNRKKSDAVSKPVAIDEVIEPTVESADVKASVTESSAIETAPAHEKKNKMRMLLDVLKNKSEQESEKEEK